MSVVRQLVQIAMVEASRDRTIAADNVFDSRMDTLDGLMKGARKPVLIFSIEEAEARETDQATAGFLGRETVFTAMVQAAVASGRAVQGDGGVVIMPEIGETDSAYEGLLNILDRQWRQALSDFENPWAVILRNLTVSIGVIKDTRATDPDTGTKHAARFTQFEIRVMPEPLPGQVMPEAIEAGLAALEADGDDGYAKLAQKWRDQLGEGSNWPEWRQLQAALFATGGDMVALGAFEDEGAQVFQELQVEISGIAPVVVNDDP